MDTADVEVRRSVTPLCAEIPPALEQRFKELVSEFRSTYGRMMKASEVEKAVRCDPAKTEIPRVQFGPRVYRYMPEDVAAFMVRNTIMPNSSGKGY